MATESFPASVLDGDTVLTINQAIVLEALRLAVYAKGNTPQTEIMKLARAFVREITKAGTAQDTDDE